MFKTTLVGFFRNRTNQFSFLVCFVDLARRIRQRQWIEDVEFPSDGGSRILVAPYLCCYNRVAVLFGSACSFEESKRSLGRITLTVNEPENQRRTQRCSEVADRPFTNGKFTCRDIRDRNRSAV
jgi:hypothetical protein